MKKAFRMSIIHPHAARAGQNFSKFHSRPSSDVRLAQNLSHYDHCHGVNRRLLVACF